MARKSARLIGKDLGGFSSRKVNQMLFHAGFIKNISPEGHTPRWELTDLGKLHGEKSKNRDFDIPIWDDDVADILKKLFRLD